MKRFDTKKIIKESFLVTDRFLWLNGINGVLNETEKVKNKVIKKAKDKGFRAYDLTVVYGDKRLNSNKYPTTLGECLPPYKVEVILREI